MPGLTSDDEAMSAYEQSRVERIRENIEKMKKLGIFDLSLNLKLASNNSSLLRSRKTHHNNNKTPPSLSPLQRSEPTRRSSRLKNGTPTSYSEMELKKKNKVALRDDEDLTLEVGSRPEIYTEEHEKLLGSTEKSWTPFVDGYGRDGKRIYDPVKGKTCHQCRQKTLGYRTHCIQCNKVQGQFCGDCLYMRYGEHVLEALENPNWICPVCRGICNCSLCRQAKGWAPTGYLYKKVKNLGFKSVAHYLIQTCRAEANPVNNQDAANEVSVKRSLAFSDTEALSKDSVKVADDKPGSSELKDNSDDEFKKDNCAQDSSKRTLLFSDATPASENIISQIEDAKNEVTELEERVLDEKQIVSKISLEKKINQENITTPKLKQATPVTVTTNSDSIAGRLKQRRREGNDCNEEKISSVKHAVKGVFPENEMAKQKEVLPSNDKHLSDGNIQREKTRNRKQKLALVVVPSEESVDGRLRQRRRMGKSLGGSDNAVSTQVPASSQPISDRIAARLRSSCKST